MLAKSAVKIESKMPHPCEVTRARCHPKDNDLAASILNSGELMLYRFSKQSEEATLTGHSKEGYGLQFSETHLVTGSCDTTV